MSWARFVSFAWASAIYLYSASVPANALFAAELVVSPEQVVLASPYDQVQLVVSLRQSSEENPNLAQDVSDRASYALTGAPVVSVNGAGRIWPLATGEATLTVSCDGLTREIPVSVSGLEAPPAPSFLRHVEPIINKAGCNAGACHASQHGKGGFVLSVFGFDPQKDWEAMVRDRAGRRADPFHAEESLIVKKPTLQVAHGGGRRLEPDSPDLATLLAWLKRGMPQPDSAEPAVTAMRVEPTERISPVDAGHQLRAVATYADGTERDVTAWCRFDSMDDAVGKVTGTGRISAIASGQATVLVRYAGQVALFNLVVPYPHQAALANWQPQNVIDELAAVRFKELGIEPSDMCDDAAFLRRAYVDAIGTLPTLEETTAFLDSTDPQKRAKLVDSLLGLTGDPNLDRFNDDYAALWALKWSDLIRTSADNLGDQGMWSMYNWIRESFRTNKKFDQFVREIVTAQGSLYVNGPANYYRIAQGAPDLAESTAQLFMGVRLQCAKCHHHPFEVYGQDDYYSFAAFFARVGTKTSLEFGVFGNEQVLVVRSGGEVGHPRTGAVMQPKPLLGEPVDHPLDRRIALAEWMTSKENAYFAKNVVNRYCGYLLGRGLVEPIDDIRDTNPPSNPALMQALCDHFVANGYDIKQLMRLIMHSRLYQLSSQPTVQNAADSRFYSSFRVKRLSAEPLLDAVDYATGTATKFPNLPLGTKAIELPDSNYPDHFLVTFGKPRRVSVCECERVPDENLAQALHMLNGDILSGKLSSAEGRVAKLVARGASHEEAVTELYLVTLCRRPSSAEVEAARELLAASSGPQEAYEDLLWALINSKQFLFVH